jgi:hypothetical protein
MTFDSIQRIKSQGTRHHQPEESLTNDQFHGIDELATIHNTLFHWWPSQRAKK